MNKEIEKLKEDYKKEFCNYEITDETEIWYATPEKILEWLTNRLEAIVRQGEVQPVQKSVEDFEESAKELLEHIGLKPFTKQQLLRAYHFLIDFYHGLKRAGRLIDDGKTN